MVQCSGLVGYDSTHCLKAQNNEMETFTCLFQATSGDSIGGVLIKKKQNHTSNSEVRKRKCNDHRKTHSEMSTNQQIWKRQHLISRLWGIKEQFL